MENVPNEMTVLAEEAARRVLELEFRQRAWSINNTFETQDELEAEAPRQLIQEVSSPLKKPGRKPLPLEEKRLRKQQRDREISHRNREKKREEVDQLREQVASLKKQLAQVTCERDALKEGR
jgi:hypothetical protein